jgi:hypothetical protein
MGIDGAGLGAYHKPEKIIVDVDAGLVVIVVVLVLVRPQGRKAVGRTASFS